MILIIFMKEDPHKCTLQALQSLDLPLTGFTGFEQAPQLALALLLVPGPAAALFCYLPFAM